MNTTSRSSGEQVMGLYEERVDLLPAGREEVPPVAPQETEYVPGGDRFADEPGDADHGAVPDRPPEPPCSDGRRSLAHQALGQLLAQPPLMGAVRRVREEFERLFMIRFLRRWPDEIRLPGGMAESPAVRILAWRCSDALHPFKRVVSRTPGARGSAGAVALLPADLLGPGGHPLADRVWEGAERLLGQREAAVVEGDRVAALEGEADGSGDLSGVAALLWRLGYLLEPDPRLSSRPEPILVLLRAPPGESLGPLSALSRDVATIGALVLRALGERASLEGLGSPVWARVVTAGGIPASDLARTEARVRWLIATGRRGSGLRARLGCLDEGRRRRLAEALTGLVPAPAAASAPVVQAVVRVWRLLGLGPDEAYMALHDRALGRPSAPRSVAAGAPGPGLDRQQVDATRRETEAARTALARHLGDEEEPPPAPSPGGLHGAHVALLRDLADRPRWARREVAALAAGHGLLPEAALDRINETALEKWGEPAIEGEDPLEVHPRAHELTREGFDLKGADLR